MMTPEQQQAFRTRIQSDCVSGVALDRIVVAVSEMLAAERAATVERMKSLLLDAHATWHNCRLEEGERGLPAGTPCDDCIETADAAIRAQGGGK